MKIKVVVREAEEGGLWAEVPARQVRKHRASFDSHSRESSAQDGPAAHLAKLADIPDDELR